MGNLCASIAPLIFHINLRFTYRDLYPDLQRTNDGVFEESSRDLY